MPADKAFSGEKFRLARLLHGWSKADIADQLQISRQFIHAIEIGEKAPSSELLAGLCLLLQVQPAFFASTGGSEVREDQVHFRSRANMPDKLANQIVAHGTAIEALVGVLEKKLTLPRVDFPQLDAHSPDEIEQAAMECRRHWKLGTGPIGNMCRVLENAGAVLTYFSTERREVDAVSMARTRPIVVRNTAKTSPGRQRFDLGHECAHLVLHSGVKTGDDATEAQANMFAAAFLMPRDAFTKEFPAMTGRLEWQPLYSLKLRWRVSVKAVLRRAHTLELLNTVQYQAGNRFLGQSGQSRIERYDERLPKEEPEVLRTAMCTMDRQYAIGTSELAAQCGMTPALLKRLVFVDHTNEVNTDEQRTRSDGLPERGQDLGEQAQ